MADIASSDITVTQVGKTEIGKQSRTSVFDLAFGNGTLTYPVGGVPLSLSALGFKRNIESLVFADQGNANGFVYKWDKGNNKILIYTQGVTHGAAGATTLDDYPLTAGVGVTSGLSVSLNGPAGAQTSRLGPLKELAATDTPAAVTLRVTVRGW